MTRMSTDQVDSDWAGTLARVRQGETVLIEENGQVLAQLTSTPTSVSPAEQEMRTFGSLVGKIKVPDDFNEMMREEVEEMFYGKP